MSRTVEARRLLGLSLPIAAAHVGQVGMGWIDTALVGRLDETALAGVGLGTSLTTVGILLGLGVMLGMDSLTAQRIGAGDRAGARETLRDALWLTIPVFAVIVPLLLLMTQIVLGSSLPGGSRAGWLTFEPKVAEIARDYVWTRLPGHLPFLTFAAFRSWLYADHRPAPVLIATLVANVVHFALAWCLVLGSDWLKISGCGAQPLGWVTSFAYFVSALWLWPSVRKDLRWRGVSRMRAVGVGMRSILSQGLPIGLQITLDAGVFTAVAVLMNAISPLQGSAHQITNQLVGFTFVVAVGLGNAASVRVGHAVGREDMPAARRAGTTAIAIGTAWMCSMGLAFGLCSRTLAGLFTADLAIVAATSELIRIAALFQVFDGLQAVCSGALRGAGMTRFPFLANLVGQWVLGLPLGYGLAVHAGLGGRGLWFGLTAGIVAVGCLLLVRTRLVLARNIARLR